MLKDMLRVNRRNKSNPPSQALPGTAVVRRLRIPSPGEWDCSFLLELSSALDLAMTCVHGLLPSTAETGSRDRCLNWTT